MDFADFQIIQRKHAVTSIWQKRLCNKYNGHLEDRRKEVDNKERPRERLSLRKDKDNRTDGKDNNSLTDFKRTSPGEEDLQIAISEKNVGETIADIIILWGRTVTVTDGLMGMTAITEEVETTGTTSSTIRTTMETMGTRVNNRGIL